MGFWSSFFGAGVAHAYNDMQKEKQSNKNWNDLFSEISNYEEQFINWLRSIGCDATYTFDVEAVNNGNISPEKRKIDSYRQKMNEFISLGGKPEYIHQIEDLDGSTIEMMKYLIEKGCVERQEEFLGFGDALYWAKSALEDE